MSELLAGTGQLPEGGSSALTRGVRFTAIFAQSNLLAIGTIKELRAHGIGFPEEVSVVG